MLHGGAPFYGLPIGHKEPFSGAPMGNDLRAHTLENCVHFHDKYLCIIPTNILTNILESLLSKPYILWGFTLMLKLFEGG